MSDRSTPAHGYSPPAPDQLVLFWDEMLLMPRVLWTCWYDMMIDTMLGTIPQRATWPEGAGR